MVINSFENRTFMQANVKAQHAVWGASFCFFWVWEWGRVGFFIFSFFLMCSQAPNFFLKTLASHFSSHIVQPSLNQHLYIDCKGVRGVWDDRGQREAWQSMFLFWGGKYILGFYLVKFPMFQTYWWWANQLASSGAKKTVGAPFH
jgi:hypothetical protein